MVGVRGSAELVPRLGVSWTVRDPAGAIVPAWKVFWTLFGTSNQLLAALTLVTVTVWLKRSGRPWLITAIPAAFMLVMTFWSLLLAVRPWALELLSGRFAANGVSLVALVLLGLAALVLTEGLKAFARPVQSTAKR